MHLSQLVGIYFIRRLNLSLAATLDQAAAVPPRPFPRYVHVFALRVCPAIAGHVVYSPDCSAKIKMLFTADANCWPVFYASLSARERAGSRLDGVPA